jgi:dienelactone hydrolase
VPTQPIFFANQGNKLAAVLHLPDTTTTPPCVITCHGLFSSKDSDKFADMGERFSKEGVALLRYDSYGCGESEGRIEETTLSGRLGDLQAALALVRSHSSLGQRLGIVGSSFGGCLALHAAALEKDVQALVTWATPLHWQGMREKIEGRENPRLEERFYGDLTKHALQPVIRRVCNLLILHGESDELVPVSHARGIYNYAREPKQIVTFEGGDHSFSDPEKREQALSLTVQWMKHYLVGA